MMPPPPAGPDRFRWLQWLQLGLTAALLVLFVNQLIAFRDVNRKIARLHERMDALESNRLLESRTALQSSQRTMEQRLLQIEATLRALAAESQGSSSGQREIPAFQIPPPPRILP